jgi:hypothetical protein
MQADTTWPKLTSSGFPLKLCMTQRNTAGQIKQFPETSDYRMAVTESAFWLPRYATLPGRKPPMNAAAAQRCRTLIFTGSKIRLQIRWTKFSTAA